MSDARDPFAAENPYAAPRSTDVAAPPATLVDDGLPLQPWRTIWTAPRRTIRRIVCRDPNLHVAGLLCLNGIGQALGRASQKNAGDELSLWGILGTAVVGGALAGVFGGWVMSHLLRFSGRWIGGVAERRHLLAAIAWAAVPSVAGMTMWVPQFAVAGMDMFTSVTPRLDASSTAAMVVMVTGGVELVLGVWGLVLLCNTVAEVQGFRSAWAGLGNLLLAGLLIVGVALGIGAAIFGIVTLARR